MEILWNVQQTDKKKHENWDYLTPSDVDVAHLVHALCIGFETIL